MEQINKKGIQLNMAVGAIVTLVLVAVLVIVALVMFDSIGTSLRVPGTSSTIANESTTTAVTERPVSLYAAGLTGRNPVCTLSYCANSTGNIVIPIKNLTWTPGCTVAFNGTTAVDANAYNNSVWKCSYTYTYDANSAASNASDTNITDFSGYPALIGLVGTIIFMGIVIGVLVASFVFGGKSGP